MQQYASGEYSFVSGLLPEKAVQMTDHELFTLLHQRYGTISMTQALDPNATVVSPLHGQTDSQWIKRANTVGINVRTISSFINVVKYALTLPSCQDSIHLLPIWEPGVVASLYGIASWQINPEFYSQSLALQVPALNTVEKQLKATVNLLHLMGKKVGMDVIPHTDRYSEIVLANPAYFEWLKREELEIVDHRSALHKDAEQVIMDWLKEVGPAQGLVYPQDAAEFFSADFAEANRLLVLFGRPNHYGGRQARREQLVDWLFHRGLEPVPATMAPPYRGLEVDPDPEALTVDAAGRSWRDYRITKPQEMSRVFGPLSRFKLYERLDDNQNWAIDFSRPRHEVWQYFCEHYATIQAAYNFDFMRGDMSHVQMRPEGVPAERDEFYDPLRAVRQHIKQRIPYFAYFAESFLAGPNFMAYGDEVDHLEASLADSTLGNLQSMVVGEAEFMSNFRYYLDVLAQRDSSPNFTIITGDKDDPRFDKFYLKGNELRLFLGLFLTDMPSYISLGFCQRDPHPEPAPNEHYTKLYVFQIEEGSKATQGPYIWGSNTELFERLNNIRLFAEQILPQIQNASSHWLLSPDPRAEAKVAAWTQMKAPRYLFVANFDLEASQHNIKLPTPPLYAGQPMQQLFSTHQSPSRHLLFAEGRWVIDELLPGECRCYGI